MFAITNDNDILKDFRNIGYKDFSDSKDEQAMKEALDKVAKEFGKVYPIVIDGERYARDERITSINPSNLDECVGYVSKADEKMVNLALDTATKRFEEWKFVSPKERAEYLFKTAEIMKKRRFELDAWMVYEVGKNWIEADADTAEAIDFLEYYGRQMLRYAEGVPVVQIPTEKTEFVYIPLGVGVVIPPWNFPAAILTGMTSAALVTGNTVVLKPASIASIIGYKIFEMFEDAGIPKGVLNFVPGTGPEIGDLLVSSPKTRFINFTGSRAVGIRINELAAKVQPGQKWLKRVILEMGGKDAVVVDETADLEAAADGIVASAFGFQGQKCSAGSRAIVVKEVYDEVLEKVVEKTKKLKVGDTRYKETYLGPVSSKEAFDKVMKYIEIGKKEARLVYGGNPVEGKNGYYIEPTIFANADRNARISQEEIFGPVVAFIKASDFDDAMEIANGTDYGLTGSLYSRSRERIEKAKKVFHVGNLYFNRKCTGALVGVHPFGGFNLSGTDSKAGGPDYLLLLMQGKSISEKIR